MKAITRDEARKFFGEGATFIPVLASTDFSTDQGGIKKNTPGKIRPSDILQYFVENPSKQVPVFFEEADGPAVILSNPTIVSWDCLELKA